MALFLERGFDAVTVDDIARAAAISRRGFFDYFPAKEDVVQAWQDAFGEALAAEVAARPEGEPMARVVEEAMVSAISASATPLAFALDQLISSTRSLAASAHLKYARLEQTLAAALAARPGGRGDLGERFLAMAAVGALRLGADRWRADATPENAEVKAREVAREMWSASRSLGDEA